MSRRRKLKKRKRKQLKNALKKARQVSKQTVAPTQPMQKYQFVLNRIYDGSVRVMGRNLLNLNATMRYHCDKCDTEFYGKAAHLIGAEYQRHKCYYPYGVADEERSKYVVPKYIKSRSKSNPIDENLFYQMVEEDYSCREIAARFGISPDLVKWWFKEEGLI